MTATTTKNLGRKKRTTRQRVKERYAKAREDAQLAGVIPVTPEGAVRDERVDPASQDDARVEELDREAVSKGWTVPNRVKRQVVNRLAEVFYEGPQTVITKDGREVVVPPDRNIMAKTAQVLLTADQRQYERDNPVEAGKAKGGGAEVNVQVNLFEVLAKAAQVDRPDDVEQRIGAVEASYDTARDDGRAAE